MYNATILYLDNKYFLLYKSTTMKTTVFVVLLVLTAFLGSYAYHVEDSIASGCTSLVAAACFLLAFWLPDKIEKNKD